MQHIGGQLDGLTSISKTLSIPDFGASPLVGMGNANDVRGGADGGRTAGALMLLKGRSKPKERGESDATGCHEQ